MEPPVSAHDLGLLTGKIRLLLAVRSDPACPNGDHSGQSGCGLLCSPPICALPGYTGLHLRAPMAAEGTEGIVSQFAGVYREWAPRASLREHVRCLWINDLRAARSSNLRVVPDGCVDIIWTGESLCVAGPDTEAILTELPCRSIVVGVRFHPGTAAAWLGQPVGEIVNTRVPLAAFWRHEAPRLTDGAAARGCGRQVAEGLEAFLAGRLASVGSVDPGIAFLRRTAGDNRAPAGLKLDQLAAHMGTSERTLRRRSLDVFGYGFKTLDRILRFQRFFRLAARAEKRDLATLAARAGYADQAHLSREVRRISGITPGDFVVQMQGSLADSFKTAFAGHM
ncbi:AraC family transcriptional regulator [Acidobacteria bacterium AB60]|nr:AraC family transcriptional regulator [Acidobacteria bacterium AB60]